MQMIEKKFRVYDPLTKTYAYVDLRSAMGNLPLDIPPENVCQFTGLQDRNGSDIYETDTLQNDDGEVATIIWENGKWESLEWARTPLWSQWKLVNRTPRQQNETHK